MVPTFRSWTHTPDDSYMYQLSLVVATATVSYSSTSKSTSCLVLEALRSCLNSLYKAGPGKRSIKRQFCHAPRNFSSYDLKFWDVIWNELIKQMTETPKKKKKHFLGDFLAIFDPRESFWRPRVGRK